MKIPRVEDFYPDAVPPLGSPMDTLPAIEKPTRSPEPPSPRPDEPANDGSRDRENARTPERRFIKRHSFDIYDDQVRTLKQWALQEELDGGVGSMSAMVRDALEAFIARRKQEK